MPNKRYGLKLNFEGAPATPHTVPGVPGLYRPGVPTPVGEEGEVPVEVARQAAKEHGDVFDLVELKAEEVDALVELAKATDDETRRGLDVAARVAEGAEVALVKEQKRAAQKKA